MIRDCETLRRFERDYSRDRYASQTFDEALTIFTALWNEAVMLNPDFPGDWRDDIQPDLDIARAVNGLPPKP